MNTVEEILDSDGFFDRLPDDVVLSIFNKVRDAKSICLSMSMCKRFRYIVPQVDEIFLSIPRKTPVGRACEEEFSSKNGLKNGVIKTLMKLNPIRFISQMMKLKTKDEHKGCNSCLYYVPKEVVKPFKEIRGLHLRLPGHGIEKLGSKICKKGRNSTTFLKWKADFGSQLQSCVILGANSWTEKSDKDEIFLQTVDELGHGSRVMAEEELKLRIVWTLSCLIAASARHCLVQETVKGHKFIESVVVSDEIEQGRISMNREQIEEMKQMGLANEALSLDCTSKMPALRMKMWYAERLQLPGSGKIMEGATLMVVRPAGESGSARSNGDLVAAAFGGEGEEELVEFARKLVVSKKYLTLEMNAF